MADLTMIERRVLKDLLGMDGGYVLNFSDDEFAQFFRQFRIDIEDEEYRFYGPSKAKRMRAFWEVATDVEVGRVIEGLLEYIEAVSPDEAGGPVEDRHKQIVERLLGRQLRSQTKTGTEQGFLEADFGGIELRGLRLDPMIEGVIEQRLEEIDRCVRSDAPLAALFLIGSTLEALLLNAAKADVVRFNQAQAAPKDSNGKVKRLPSWTLNELIDVGCEVGAIGLDVKKFSHALRDFRNFIHPFEQARSRFKPDSQTAKISRQVLRAAVADLAGTG